MKIVSTSEMKELDRWAIEDLGIPSIILMENAGRGISEIAIETLKKDRNKKIAVFCGTGNNGGDGLVAARYLLNKEFDIKIYIIGKREDLKPDPKINLGILEKMRADIEEVSGPVAINTDLIIDAIFGIGLKDKIREPTKGIIESLNKCDIPILSIDVPSGLDADNGVPLSIAIKAKKTATLQFPKKGFYINEGPLYTGKVIVLDIGIPTQKIKLFDNLKYKEYIYYLKLRRITMATARKSIRRNEVWQERKNPDFNALIAERAYRIFEKKGCSHGHDLDDWLEAERQVLVELKRNRGSRIL